MELDKKALETAAEKLKEFAVKPDEGMDTAEAAVEVAVSEPWQNVSNDAGAPMKCPSAVRGREENELAKVALAIRGHFGAYHPNTIIPESIEAAQAVMSVLRPPMPLSELQAVSIMFLAYIKAAPDLPCYGKAMEAAWRALRERLYPAEKSPEAITEKE